jgi:hypothetical protein
MLTKLLKLNYSQEEDRQTNPIYKPMEMQKNNIGINNDINNDNQINHNA